MTTNTRQFHEFGYTQLASLADDAVKAQYEAAFDADPVNGFRFGHHIKNRGFAGELFKKAAALAPASAFADMQSYGFKLSVDALSEIRDDATLAATMRKSLTDNQEHAVAKAEKDAKAQIAQLEKQAKGGAPEAFQISAILERVGQVKKFDLEGHIAAKTANAMEQRAVYQKEQATYPWLEDVLVTAAAASPKVAETYRPLWENLPFKDAIEAAMQGRGTTNWSAKASQGNQLSATHAWR